MLSLESRGSERLRADSSLQLARTAVGAFGGALKSIPVVELGALVLKESLKKAGLRPLAGEAAIQFEPDAIGGRGQIELEKTYHDYDDSLTPVVVDEVIMGNVVGAGQGQNVARQAMIRAGIAKESGAFTVNKVCASGMKAVTQPVLTSPKLVQELFVIRRNDD